MDYDLFRSINARGPEFLHGVFRFGAAELTYVICVAIALLFLIPWRSKRVERRRAAVLAPIGAGVALVVAQIISQLVDRPRPFVAHPATTHLLITHAKDSGFPSDHATGTFAIAAAVWLYDRVLGAVFFVLAAIVAFSRVYVGAHYPSDVLAGAVLGVLCVALLRLAVLRNALERLADGCGRVWDALLGRLGARRLATGSRSD